MDLMRTILGLDKENNRKSNYIIALSSARCLTGRNPLDGTASSINDMRCNLLNIDNIHCNDKQLRNEQPIDEKMMIGLTIYLILLDLIGCLFEKKDSFIKYKNGVKKALSLFSSLKDEEIEAINNLRNTLAHNFGLATEIRYDKRGKEIKGRKFTLSFSDHDPIIRLPIKEWDTKYEDKSEDTSTIIGIYAFCNEIEQVIKNLMDTYHLGELKFNKSLSEEEIISRFTVRM